MDTAIYANIFYVIATIATIAVSVTLIVALLYLINVLREFLEISRRTKDTTSLVSAFIEKIFKRKSRGKEKINGE